ncbi:hypothetical protein SAICODRAFT_198613 [Saitoella complicata NRRL Y-17804]|uniref:uncharacterized protein n=1 Tax=Saitoella complicata (strain BCRC 22490 / CBS 7301 / JCM 7358 / NBRC 10748 / NRRL Y-17804) TaxID=698492 RepID=UPI000867A840|nr:uncharacterized protein SAICODRAFT_198613 [Saitoella complicata NRRL Y-17804]ODQ55031.1 hypothetical protein SAICODRAFT_198613 [Saitoella complicata NRRL Y-17804]
MGDTAVAGDGFSLLPRHRLSPYSLQLQPTLSSISLQLTASSLYSGRSTLVSYSRTPSSLCSLIIVLPCCCPLSLLYTRHRTLSLLYSRHSTRSSS